MRTVVFGVAAALVAGLVLEPRAEQSAPPTLLPTNHAKVPRDLSRLWLVPDRSRAVPAAFQTLAAAARLEASNEYSKALTLLSDPALVQGPLGAYAVYYSAEASLKLGRGGDAHRAFGAVAARGPIGYLAEAAAIGEAEADEAQADFSSAVAVYERLLAAGSGPDDELSMRLGRAAAAGGNPTRAAAAFSHVYYDLALSDLAPAAGQELQHLGTLGPIAAGNDRYRLEMARAERLFAAKQYGPARAAFDGLAAAATDDSELVHLRVAECDYFLKHGRVAREELRPYLERASRQAEALYFFAVVSLDLSDRQTFLKTARRVADEFPKETWAADALDSLAGDALQQNDDEQAEALFEELYTKFPRGSHAERAAWRVGWTAFRQGRYADAYRTFEQAAHDFPRSDYRPPWLYWSGRAHEQIGEQAAAEERYKLEMADYANTYHGHLTATRLKGWTPTPRVILAADTATDRDGDAPVLPPLPPNAETIRQLLSVNLFDAASDELRYAARTWGDSPAIQATTAWIQRQQGRSETGTRQFDLFRGSINTMKRAYPQYLAAGGEQLPRDIMVMIYPLAYWDVIKKYSEENDLDPYLVAALTAQESTFVPDIKSYAGAVGLMQFMAPTARQYARRLGLPYSSRLLTNADANLHMGAVYFSDLVKAFGETYLALAAYNGGPTNVRRWMGDRAGLPRDEFIDDIPYAQTQNYVKKILATAEDYRRLYGPDAEGGQEPDLDAKGLTTASAPKRTTPVAQKTASTTSKTPAKKAPPKKPAPAKPAATGTTAAGK